MYPQKGILFSGNIASNIKYGAENASDEQMLEAATIAQATELLIVKKKNMIVLFHRVELMFQEDRNSVYQLQEQLPKNPRIYIFDDSFSALDFKTDAALRKALSPKVKESTVIIVAQRISTVLQAKQIIVLDDGKMVGKGTHKELMKNCEVYKQIASSQMSEAELATSLNEEVDKDE